MVLKYYLYIILLKISQSERNKNNGNTGYYAKTGSER